MNKFRLGALVAAAGLTVSACSGIHPGQAVVVDGTSYSVGAVDDLSESFCVYAVASQQTQQQGTPQQDVPGGAVRQQTVKSLIELTVAKDVADDLGVSVPPSEYALSGEQLAGIEKSFGDTKTKHLKKVVEMLQRTGLIYTEIGAKKEGVSSDSGDPKKLAATGQKAVQEAIKDADVSVDPRYNLSDDAEAEKSGSGSLSVAVSKLAEADPTQAAASQRCS